MPRTNVSVRADVAIAAALSAKRSSRIIGCRQRAEFSQKGSA